MLSIDSQEILIRGILHPFFYSRSKNKLKDVVFLPPPNTNTVSLNRLRYTNADFCKQHAKTINMPEHTYCGLASIKVDNIYTVCKNFSLNAEVVASPIDAKGDYIDTKKIKVFVDTPGLPMHSDLSYPILSNNPVESHAPNTNLRKIASEIVKVAKYYHDPSPNDIDWKGDPLPS